MKPLDPTYVKNGFHYEVLMREGAFAIAQQRLRPGVGRLAFEVWRIQQDKDRTIAGVLIPAHERPPGNEQWGRHGWTFPTLEGAKRRFRQLVDSQPRKTI